LAQANLPESLTVRANGAAHTLSGALLKHVETERNRAVVARQQKSPSLYVTIRRELREAVAAELKVSLDTAGLILAGLRNVQGKPEQLDLAVRWSGRGWKLYIVTGTRHAYYLLRKLAQREGFEAARLNDVIVRSDGYVLDNVIHLSVDDVTGSDSAGKYRALLDRNNAHYDLARDALQD
jgi:phosphoserine phosphatase